jgi:hypothetical protein
MARRKYPRVRFEQMTYIAFQALPDDEKTSVWEEYTNALKERGDYNANATETFFDTLEKSINSDK